VEDLLSKTGFEFKKKRRRRRRKEQLDINQFLDLI
jgi:transposase